MKLRNINPIGHADVPLIYRQGEPFDQEGVGCLQPGEEFEVTEEQARQLLPQVGNYEPADAEATLLQQQMQADAEATEEQQADPAADQTPAAPATAEPLAATGTDAGSPPPADIPPPTAQEGND